MIAWRTPHRFEVSEYEQLIEYGILTEDDWVELIRGQVLDKEPVSDPHVACVDRLNRLLIRAVGDNAIVSIQNPIRLADSEPEPDVVLKRQGVYGKPGPADILLVIEVADASLEDDREVKRPLYAENGIAEYWIVNLIDGCLEVHRQPRADGTYADVRTLRTAETVGVGALPGVTITVAGIA